MKKYNEIPEQEIKQALQKLADRIKQLRKEKGYKSSEAFAYDHGIPRAQYARYEKSTDMRFTSLYRLAKVYGMTLEEFFSKGFD